MPTVRAESDLGHVLPEHAPPLRPLVPGQGTEARDTNPVGRERPSLPPVGRRVAPVYQTVAETGTPSSGCRSAGSRNSSWQETAPVVLYLSVSNSTG
jgi:hypothetical protein